jgi:hypothetical protein
MDRPNLFAITNEPGRILGFLHGSTRANEKLITQLQSIVNTPITKGIFERSD